MKGAAVRLSTSWVLSSTNSSTKVHARRIPVRIEYLHDRITCRGFRYTIRYPNANRPNSCLMHGWSALCLNYQIRADVLELRTQSPDSSYIEIPTQGNNREMTYHRSGITNAITAANDQDRVLSSIAILARSLWNSAAIDAVITLLAFAPTPLNRVPMSLIQQPDFASAQEAQIGRL